MLQFSEHAPLYQMQVSPGRCRPAVVVTQFETALQSNAVIPSAARFLRPGWVCGARDLLFASGRQNFKLSHYPSGTPEGGCPPGFLARMSLTATMLVRSTRCCRR